MTKHQPQELTGTSQSEVKKQDYQVPKLEQHNFLKLTGVSLPIGTRLDPGSFDILELQ
jgi:hypothetical protein